ncbi:hypothetical protein PINS_up020912 [Pythium insidiosum]|nr:hypothetical protein PINS_up020912 [Pythium insidiosum]
MRVEDADPEYMIKQSFHQFQNEQAAPALEDALERTRQERDQIIVKNESEVAELLLSLQVAGEAEGRVSRCAQQAGSCRALPQRGTSCEALCPDPTIGNAKKWDWGVIVNFTTKNAADSTSPTP